MPSGTVGDVPGKGWVVEAVGVLLLKAERALALVDVGVARENEVDIVLCQERLEDVLAGPADGAAVVLVAEVPGPVAGDDNPGRLGAVDGREVGFEPGRLGVHGGVDGAGAFSFDTANFVVADEAMAEVGLGVNLDKVRETAVPAVPEVARSARGVRGHAEVVLVPREVGLARHADAHVVGNIVRLVSGAAIVAVGFVIARPHHPRLIRGDAHHLVVKVIQDGLVHLVPVSDGRVLEEALNLLLEPVVGVRNVAAMPKKVIARLHSSKGLDSVLLARLEDVVGRDARGGVGGQAAGTHGTQVCNVGNGQGSGITGLAAGGEVERLLVGSVQQRGRLVKVGGAGLEAGDEDVVVVRRRSRVRDRDGGLGRLVEIALGQAPAHHRLIHAFKRVPADHHAIVTMEGETDLRGVVDAVDEGINSRRNGHNQQREGAHSQGQLQSRPSVCR